MHVLSHAGPECTLDYYRPETEVGSEGEWRDLEMRATWLEDCLQIRYGECGVDVRLRHAYPMLHMKDARDADAMWQKERASSFGAWSVFAV